MALHLTHFAIALQGKRYVAERTGRGSQNLLRGFDPLRNHYSYGKQSLVGRCFHTALFLPFISHWIVSLLP